MALSGDDKLKDIKNRFEQTQINVLDLASLYTRLWCLTTTTTAL